MSERDRELAREYGAHWPNGEESFVEFITRVRDEGRHIFRRRVPRAHETRGAPWTDIRVELPAPRAQGRHARVLFQGQANAIFQGQRG